MPLRKCGALALGRKRTVSDEGSVRLWCYTIHAIASSRDLKRRARLSGLIHD
jgi:hypothetical protein